jgi:hypothetical protein
VASAEAESRPVIDLEEAAAIRAHFGGEHSRRALHNQ